MAEAEISANMEEVLNPFYQRASEAEERLAKLEALFSSKDESDHGCANKDDISATIKDFESKLEIAQDELIRERDKASKEIQKLTAENLKLQYRINHLVRAVKEVDSKLAT